MRGAAHPWRDRAAGARAVNLAYVYIALHAPLPSLPTRRCSYRLYRISVPKPAVQPQRHSLISVVAKNGGGPAAK